MPLPADPTEDAPELPVILRPPERSATCIASFLFVNCPSLCPVKGFLTRNCGPSSPSITVEITGSNPDAGVPGPTAPGLAFAIFSGVPGILANSSGGIL